MNVKEMMKSMGVDFEEIQGEVGKEIKKTQKEIMDKLNLILISIKPILEHIKKEE